MYKTRLSWAVLGEERKGSREREPGAAPVGKRYKKGQVTKCLDSIGKRSGRWACCPWAGEFRAERGWGMPVIPCNR